MLEAEGIEVHFEGLTAIDQVSIGVNEGEVFGLIGPNGAGKSTLVNALTGFQKFSHGVVRLDSVDISGWTADRIARHGVARTFQAVRLFLGLTQDLIPTATSGGQHILYYLFKPHFKAILS